MKFTLSKLFTSACFGSQFDCEPYLASGWSRPEPGFVWTEGPHSVLRLGRPVDNVDCRLDITLSPFVSVSCPYQTLKLAANASWIASLIIHEQDVRLSLFVSAETISLADTLELAFYNLSPGRPSEDDPTSNDKRLLAFALKSAALIPLLATARTLSAIPANLLFADSTIALETARCRGSDQEAAEHAFAGYSKDKLLPRLLEAYMRNVGTSTDYRRRFAEIIQASSDSRNVVDGTRQLSTDTINRFLDGYRHLRFALADAPQAGAKVVFEATANPFLDKLLGDHALEAFRAEQRPPFAIYSFEDGSALIHPYKYLICTRDGRAVLPDANLKGMSRLALDVFSTQIDRPLVLLQDYFDAGNISHFIFDNVTRLFHFCKSFPQEAPNALFIFGGVPSEFHRIVLAAAGELLGLDMKQFLFPSEACLVHAPAIYWFTDQAQNLHPAQWMHSQSLAVLNRLAFHVNLPTGERRLYISRADAAHRRIQNEKELFEALETQGFEFVRLADLPIRKQMELVASAASIVAPHGMGLTHLVLNRGTPRLIEIFHPTLLSASYALFAMARGLRYDAVFGSVSGKDANYFVDVAAVMALNP